MANDVEHEKRALRAELRERRQLLSDAQREDAATALTRRLDELVDSLGARSISCFLSTTTEPGTREFVRAAVRRGIRVLLPVTRSDGLLDWVVATDDDDDIAEGLFGLPEPTGEVLGPIAVNDVDLMLIPAAAVDRSGMRMGWGRGYFDKTIGSMQKCPPVYAVIYDSEVLDFLPREVHDQPVTGVVTPTQTLLLSPPRR
ncbi:5-formyltetrahydrofolate cyclo-ligase [Microbacterium hydrocarbonoxydans]|uniref:5-formyltetrahydrofolate cyclo-ligase n=1 Tax=Microbacterium hydrocarbonoxydans TaxID=273678 RepID=A0A1H4K559_9MICO|nr:5-formyltetrahydrofolate cyclo-ligase [Microbacterium hydrocarbonoxydans]SEB53709.1 5-formyltetrahydrofolate cyclo-ligase [Microbacterium hydrocarbonoxydans]